MVKGLEQESIKRNPLDPLDCVRWLGSHQDFSLFLQMEAPEEEYASEKKAIVFRQICLIKPLIPGFFLINYPYIPSGIQRQAAFGT